MSQPRQLTEKQEKFLDALFGEAEGNVARAYEIAGYAGTAYSQLIASLKDEVIERCKTFLALHGPAAAMRLVGILGNDATGPGANLKLTAAQQILDRIGISKQEKVDVKVEAPTGIFILPPKKEG